MGHPMGYGSSSTFAHLVQRVHSSSVRNVRRGETWCMRVLVQCMLTSTKAVRLSLLQIGLLICSAIATSLAPRRKTNSCCPHIHCHKCANALHVCVRSRLCAAGDVSGARERDVECCALAIPDTNNFVPLSLPNNSHAVSSMCDNAVTPVLSTAFCHCILVEGRQ